MNRDGHTHLTLALTCATAAGATALVTNVETWEAFSLGFSAVAGCALTLPIRVGSTFIYLNPDMDIRINEGVLAKILPLEFYRRTVSHRSGLRLAHWEELWKHPWDVLFMSHLPGLGTIPRWLLVVFFACILLLMVGLADWIQVSWLLGLWLGMTISDTGHVIWDIIYSWWKKGVRE